jgi:hypothetical protein
MHDWKPWDWIAYGCLGVAAVTEAYSAAQHSAPSNLNLPPLEGAFGFAPLMLVTLASAILLIKAIRHRPARNTSAQNDGGLEQRISELEKENAELRQRQLRGAQAVHAPKCAFGFGSVPPFEQIITHGETIIRDVYFSVRNTGTGYLTNFDLFITDISPSFVGQITPWKLTPTSLSMHEDEPPRYIKLASYMEKGTGNRLGDRIIIHVPPIQSHMEHVRTLQPGDYRITLEARSPDAPTTSAICQISIGAKGRLRLREYK